MIDFDANLAAALYFAGVWDAPDTMEDDGPRMIAAADLFDCEHNPASCDYITEPADPYVGIEEATYCQVHAA